ncbi:MAG: hypothetical protein ACLU9S_05230 [Oscillospiraceae bacterium]
MFVRLTELRPVTARDTCIALPCPAIAQAALPGQFVELKLTGGCDPFLRRPISLFDADGTETFSLLVRTVGRGTEYMTGWTPGMEIDVLRPLGSGFSWETDTRDCLLVAGGIGLAPWVSWPGACWTRGSGCVCCFRPGGDAALLDALPFRERLDVSCCENRSASSRRRAGRPAGAGRGRGILLRAGGAAGIRGGGARRRTACPASCPWNGAWPAVSVSAWAVPFAIHTPGGVTYKKVCKDGPRLSGRGGGLPCSALRPVWGGLSSATPYLGPPAVPPAAWL